MRTKKILFISIICLLTFVLTGCMYLMEEDPWKWQKRADERERIRREQEINKQQSTNNTNSFQQN